jgi:hypothetical protein
MLTPVCRGEKKRQEHHHTVRNQHPITTAVDCISMLTQHAWISILVSSSSRILELNANISKMCSAWNMTKFRIKKTCYLDGSRVVRPTLPALMIQPVEWWTSLLFTIVAENILRDKWCLSVLKIATTSLHPWPNQKIWRYPASDFLHKQCLKKMHLGGVTQRVRASPGALSTCIDLVKCSVESLWYRCVR